MLAGPIWPLAWELLHATGGASKKTQKTTGAYSNLDAFAQHLNKMKRQPTEQEKTFSSSVTDKDLISKIHKWLIQLNDKKKKKTTQSKNGQKT